MAQVGDALTNTKHFRVHALLDGNTLKIEIYYGSEYPEKKLREELVTSLTFEGGFATRREAREFGGMNIGVELIGVNIRVVIRQEPRAHIAEIVMRQRPTES